MKKTYITEDKEPRSSYFRIGKALVRIDFDSNGEYATSTEIFQRAIENSHAFKSGEITLKQ